MIEIQPIYAFNAPKIEIVSGAGGATGISGQAVAYNEALIVAVDTAAKLITTQTYVVNSLST